MKKTALLSAGISFLIGISSCQGDYLDTAPTDSTGSADAMGTTENILYSLNGIAKRSYEKSVIYWK